jgi:hypothetical protein
VAVEAVPVTKSVPKAEAPTLYKILEDERTDRLE